MKRFAQVTVFFLLSLFIVNNNVSYTQGIIDTSQSPYASLKSVDFGSVKWTEGFWAQRFNQINDVTLKHLFELANNPKNGAIQNFEIAAGLKKGTYSGNNWMDAWVYKWIEAASALYAISHDDQILIQLDNLIAIIAKAQEDDGYIATQNTVRNRPRFQQPNHHEVYVMGHLLTAASIHHRFTGKTNLLDVAKKAGSFLYQQFKDKNPQMAHFPFNPSVIMGAVELYRETKEPIFLELANSVINMRGAFKGGSDQCQDRKALRYETEVVGHAVFYTYLYSGAADAYMETGDKSLLNALERLWDDLVNHKLYITGGTCALHRGFSVRNGKLWIADDVHEAVGAKYYLPNTPAYNETCGQVGNFMWNWRMLAIDGNARYADIMEREMYNGFLPGISVTGNSFTYTNPLRWFGKEHALMGNDSLDRHLPGLKHTCCPSNLLRTIAELSNYFYSISDKGFWIHHYGGNTFNDGTYDFTQETNYPWEGSITIHMEKFPSNKSLYLRIPSWVKEYTIQINKKDYKNVSLHQGYIGIDRQWKKNDEVTLQFPMEYRLIRGHRKIDSTHNQIAIQRGPIVYCLESHDLPEDVDVSEIIIPRKITLKPKFEERFLGGITTLNGRALRCPKDDSQLYSELGNQQLTPIEITLIPYFSWLNRGVSQMTVWLPIDW
jgi:DUF1680 family protein